MNKKKNENDSLSTEIMTHIQKIRLLTNKIISIEINSNYFQHF
jgi:hypothetical protein